MSDDLKRSSVLDGADLVLPSAPKAPPEPKTLDEALDQLAYGANASAEAQPVKCPACDGHEVVRYDGHDSEGWAKEGPCPLCCVPSAAREAKPVAKHATGPDGTCEPCSVILGNVRPCAISHDFTPGAHGTPATESFLRQIATENEKENERVRDELAKSAAESDAIASALRTQIAALEGQLAATRAVLRQFSAWTHMVPGPSETVTTCGIDTIGTDIKSAVVRAMVTCPICLRVPAPGQLTPAELLLSRGAEQAKKLAADRLVSNDFLHRSLGDILRGVGVEPHSNPGELVAQIAGLVKPKKLPWEAGNKYLRPGVTGPHEIRKVAPGVIVETADGRFAVKMQTPDIPGFAGNFTVCWLADGTIGIVPAMSSVMTHPAPGEEDADGAARDKANREHWASSGLPGPYIEDAEDRTNYLLNEYDRLSAWARGASQRVERMREAAAELAESCSGGDHQISQRNLIAQRIRRLTEQDTNSGTTEVRRPQGNGVAVRAAKTGCDGGHPGCSVCDALSRSTSPTVERVGVAVHATDKDGNVFLVLSSKDGRAWEYPGGKAHPGEGARDAARREFREKTGLYVTLSHDDPTGLPCAQKTDGAEYVGRVLLFRGHADGNTSHGSDASAAGRFSAPAVERLNALNLLSDLVSREFLATWAKNRANQ